MNTMHTNRIAWVVAFLVFAAGTVQVEAAGPAGKVAKSGIRRFGDDAIKLCNKVFRRNADDVARLAARQSARRHADDVARGVARMLPAKVAKPTARAARSAPSIANWKAVGAIGGIAKRQAASIAMGAGVAMIDGPLPIGDIIATAGVAGFMAWDGWQL